MNSILEQIGIDPGILIIVLLVVVLVLIFITASLSLNVHRLNRKYTAFMKGKDGQSLEKQFTEKMTYMDRIMEINEANAFDLQNLKKIQGKSLYKYGIEKYDAFDDVGGKLSFALAMLDKRNTGFILNAIHSRDNCFLYIKEIVKGESYVMLSQEEVRALEAAVAYVNDDVM